MPTAILSKRKSKREKVPVPYYGNNLTTERSNKVLTARLQILAIVFKQVQCT